MSGDDGKNAKKKAAVPPPLRRPGETGDVWKRRRKREEQIKSAPARPGTDDLVGQIIDERYRILRIIARGGMGSVYEAEHLKLMKRVALKSIHPELAGTDTHATRFAREAVANAQVDHPNVVAATDYGSLSGGGAYLVMQLAQGISLQEVLESGGMPWRRAIRIGCQVASALEAAHEKNIVHRDLKPDNIMVETKANGEDVVKILDFGIARLLNQGEAMPERMSRKLTSVGMVVGTPGYMAPEQALGDRVDARADIYGLGIILWELIAGKPLLPDDDLTNMVALQITGDLPSIAQESTEDDLPQPLIEIVDQCLRPKASERPQKVGEVRKVLARLVAKDDADRRSRISGIPAEPNLITDKKASVPPVTKPKTTGASLPPALPQEANTHENTDSEVDAQPQAPLAPPSEVFEDEKRNQTKTDTSENPAALPQVPLEETQEELLPSPAKLDDFDDDATRVAEDLSPPLKEAIEKAQIEDSSSSIGKLSRKQFSKFGPNPEVTNSPRIAPPKAPVKDETERFEIGGSEPKSSNHKSLWIALAAGALLLLVAAALWLLFMPGPEPSVTQLPPSEEQPEGKNKHQVAAKTDESTEKTSSAEESKADNQQKATTDEEIQADDDTHDSDEAINRGAPDPLAKLTAKTIDLSDDGIKKSWHDEIKTMLFSPGSRQRRKAAKRLRYLSRKSRKKPEWIDSLIRIELADGRGCRKMHQAFVRAQKTPDPRLLPALEERADRPRRGCGKGGRDDCIGCVRGVLQDTIKAIQESRDKTQSSLTQT